MITPDDPIIHSPRRHSTNSTIIAMKDDSNTLDDSSSSTAIVFDKSIESTGADAEAGRRQKTCRVCGDHATGYNFNVITCESCKAFFRRNALRPKEFKCPYSDDCEINAVSRRFCQKCRMRKCFVVGMKKEWILNDEQLRRRKNSRLNSGGSTTTTAPSHRNNGTTTTSGTRRRTTTEPLVNNQQHSGARTTTSPTVSVLSSISSICGSPESPLTTLSDADLQMAITMSNTLANMDDHNRSGSDVDDDQQQQQQQYPTSTDASSELITMTRAQLDELLHHATTKRRHSQNSSNLSCNDIHDCSCRLPTMKRERRDSGIADPIPYTSEYDLNQTDFAEVQQYSDAPIINNDAIAMRRAAARKHMELMDKTIANALSVHSPPESVNNLDQQSANGCVLHEAIVGGESRLNYQLNSAEQRAFDVVKDAFAVLNEPLDGKSAACLAKTDHTPTDILNIMDITMRRLVKMAKKLPAFNDLTHDSKFALLKGGMVEMLTLRGVTRFDIAGNCWKTPVVSENFHVSFGIFDRLKRDVKDMQKDIFLRFVSSLEDDVRTNELAIDLAVLIVLFNVDREGVNQATDGAIIARHRQHYCSLLQRFFESLHGADGLRRYESVMRALILLRQVSQSSVTLFLGTVDTAEAEALPREFFKTQ